MNDHHDEEKFWAIPNGDVAKLLLQKKEKRGLVLSMRWADDDGTLIVRGGPGPDLKRWSLFVDRLAIPRNRLVRMMNGEAERAYLEKKGLLVEPLMEPTYAAVAGEISSTAPALFSLLDEEQPGRWLLGLGESNPTLNSAILSPDRGVFLQLIDSVPIPLDDVPFEEILEFREKRIDEIEQFLVAMEEFYLKIDAANDREFALQTCIREIDKKCADLLRVATESKRFRPLKIFRLGFSLSADNLRSATERFATWGFAADTLFGLPLVGSIAGATTSALSVGVMPGKADADSDLGPFLLVALLHEDFARFSAK